MTDLVAGAADSFDIKAKIDELKGLILSKHPQMPILLRTIHSTVKQYPEQVTLLSEEDILVVVKGLEQAQGHEMASVAVKKSSSPSATKTLATKIKTLGADAF